MSATGETVKKGWMCDKCKQSYTSFWKAVQCHGSTLTRVWVTVPKEGPVKPIKVRREPWEETSAAEDDTFGLISDITGFGLL